MRVTSGGGSAQAGFVAPRRPEAPAAAAPAKKPRRFWMICIEMLLSELQKGNCGRNRAKEVLAEVGSLVSAPNSCSWSAPS